MKILITGGAGYIGFSLIQAIFQSHNQVDEIIIYDNLSRKNYSLFMNNKFNGKGIKFIHGDILDGRTLKKVLDNVEVVIHLAAKVSTPFADNEAHFFDQVNNWGTAQLVSCVEGISSVRHFVYLSSASVYGNSMEQIDENSLPFPGSFYGISKLKGEKQVQRLAQKMKVHLVRSGNVYGYNPAMRIDSVINKFMFDANFIGKINIHGNGEQIRPFIRVDKLAFILKEILYKEITSGVFNIFERNISINEIVETVKELYPELDIISINPDMNMRKIQLKPASKLLSYCTLPSKDFLDELREFKTSFSF
ncbi:NAD(P)-dependent oxidoreductase [Akkermansiaceae bacterium]|nr:NAD(P)-dependent oxidoreductase [Akkermansiaceae bacterium]